MNKSIRRLFAKIRALVEFESAILANLFRISELKKIPQADVLLICHDYNRGFTWQGKSYSTLVDSMNELLMDQGLSTVTVAKYFSYITGPDAFGSVFELNGRMSRALIWRRLKRFVFNSKSSEGDPLVTAWLDILQKVRPKVVMGIQPPEELCVAAKKVDIKTYDIQHGVLDERIYYGFTRTQSRFGSAGWPDFVLCWDDASADFVARTSQGAVKGIVIGNLWVNRFKSPCPDDALVGQWNNCLKTNSDSSPILVTLTWDLAPYGYFSPLGIPEELIDVIRNTADKYHWWLRLHPIQMQSPRFQKVQRLLAKEFDQFKGVEWIKCSEAPLPAVLSVVRVHLTVLSSVALEAESFGVKTGLLLNDRKILHEYFPRQLETGSAVIIGSNRSDIAMWLTHNWPSEKIAGWQSELKYKDNLIKFLENLI